MSRQLLETYESLFKSLCDRISIMLGRFTTHSLMERALFDTGKEHPLVKELVLQENCLDISKLMQKADELDVQSVGEGERYEE